MATARDESLPRIRCVIQQREAGSDEDQSTRASPAPGAPGRSFWNRRFLFLEFGDLVLEVFYEFMQLLFFRGIDRGRVAIVRSKRGKGLQHSFGPGRDSR